MAFLSLSRRSDWKKEEDDSRKNRATKKRETEELWIITRIESIWSSPHLDLSFCSEQKESRIYRDAESSVQVRFRFQWSTNIRTHKWLRRCARRLLSSVDWPSKSEKNWTFFFLSLVLFLFYLSLNTELDAERDEAKEKNANKRVRSSAFKDSW